MQTHIGNQYLQKHITTTANVIITGITTVSEIVQMVSQCLRSVIQMTGNKMGQYCKLPIPITAYQTDKEMDIETREGVMHANVGDYIITGVKGEQYPCKPDIFAKTYIKYGQANKMEIIAALFGKKLGEEFTLIDENREKYKAVINKNGLRVHGMYKGFWDDTFFKLITGRTVIVDE
jgi:hypothetical protein